MDNVQEVEMPKEGEKVRVLGGENKDKIGEVIGAIPISQVQELSDGNDISMEGANTFWLIEFEDGKQDIIEANMLEIIVD